MLRTSFCVTRQHESIKTGTMMILTRPFRSLATGIEEILDQPVLRTDAHIDRAISPDFRAVSASTLAIALSCHCAKPTNHDIDQSIDHNKHHGQPAVHASLDRQRPRWRPGGGDESDWGLDFNTDQGGFQVNDTPSFVRAERSPIIHEEIAPSVSGGSSATPTPTTRTRYPYRHGRRHGERGRQGQTIIHFHYQH
jgi:hypothetical protein